MKKIVLVLLLASSLFAHKVNLFVTSQKDKVEAYSYFGNSAPCKNCKIIVKNDGNIIIQDKLDEKGKYTFLPKYKNLEITIDAGSGHIVKKSIVLDKMKHEDVKKHQEEENIDKYKKIFLAFVLILIFFYIFKKVKSR